MLHVRFDIVCHMKILENQSLKNYLTMHLGGNARYMAEITNKNDIVEAVRFAKDHHLKIFVLGGGSNTLADDQGFDGIVLHMNIKGRKLLSEDDSGIEMRFGSGEIMDDIIAEAVKQQLSGMEAMSLIPGTIGAAPVQNVGAYGQDISQSFVELEAYDLKEDQFVTLTKDDCQFTYRQSIFRGSAWGRYIISSVTLRFRKALPEPPFYKQVQDHLDAQGITYYTPQIIRDTVIEIRIHKLPDPKITPNSGSFFKNAIISKDQLTALQKDYPEVKAYDMGNNQYKISTGWLIDQAGLKGKEMYGMRVHDRNALVLTNVNATSYDSLAKAREVIVDRVKEKFGITITQEVLEM